MNLKKVILKLVFFGVVLFLLYNNVDFNNFKFNQNEEFVVGNGSIEVYFCPNDDCESVLISFLDSASSKVVCALYDIDLENVIAKIDEKAEGGVDVKMIVDHRYADHVMEKDYVTIINQSAYMHNKFCVVDGEKVFTGSMNPTHRGTEVNNNNILVILSKKLARNYENVFYEIKDEKEYDNFNEIMVGDVFVENYFCPKENCAHEISEELLKANKSIYFMTFSFTLDDLGNDLLIKFYENKSVQGVFEKSQNNQYLEYYRLEDHGVDVRFDSNPANMHHKVFIIDNETVITGSMNPSNNGNKRNDENVLIIHDSEIAKMYADEFFLVKNQNFNKP